MSQTIVIADIHGRLDLLEKALTEAEAWQPAKLIFTGDFIDRGPESKAVVDRVMAGGNCPWEVIRGNHEDMALECHDGTNFDWWCANGGTQTIMSYGGKLDVAHLEWFASLPRLTWDAHRVYTHAGVSEAHTLEAQPEEVTQWHRYGKGEDVGYRGKHVVHGHTPIGPELLQNRTNLDAGSFFSGRLTLGVFDDSKAGGPVDIIEVTA